MALPDYIQYLFTMYNWKYDYQAGDESIVPSGPGSYNRAPTSCVLILQGDSKSLRRKIEAEHGTIGPARAYSPTQEAQFDPWGARRVFFVRDLQTWIQMCHYECRSGRTSMPFLFHTATSGEYQDYILMKKHSQKNDDMSLWKFYIEQIDFWKKEVERFREREEKYGA